MNIGTADPFNRLDRSRKSMETADLFDRSRKSMETADLFDRSRKSMETADLFDRSRWRRWTQQVCLTGDLGSRGIDVTVVSGRCGLSASVCLHRSVCVGLSASFCLHRSVCIGLSASACWTIGGKPYAVYAILKPQ